uniref:Rmp57 type III polyketide synthase n=1 Tax=uncultured bacterium RM57 TaxID=561246 RepID=C8XT88_9BACT|nr:Rmp57 type III polyketide synthase [uncultured bacterium RM57]
MRIASVATAYPPHRYPQTVITQALKSLWQERPAESRLLERLHSNCGVEFRHLMFPIDAYGTFSGFGESNDAYIEGAIKIGQQAIATALERAGLQPSDISAIFFASTTGLATPSIDARLTNLMDFPTNIKRTPIFGLGCVAGAAGISRAADYVRAYPKQYAILLAVELCSLTWQNGDPSMGAMVASGLFGDGAAAVVLAGEETPHAQRPRDEGVPCPRILDSRSTLYPDTEHLVGWKFKDNGFNVVLSAEIPDLVNKHLRANVDEFLADNDLSVQEICSFIFHSGGPKVLEAMEASLELPPGALSASWNSLREVGNLSSASVLSVMEDYLLNSPGDPGTHSMLAAMGPAFCSELVLLQW